MGLREAPQNRLLQVCGAQGSRKPLHTRGCTENTEAPHEMMSTELEPSSMLHARHLALGRPLIWVRPTVTAACSGSSRAS
jgi:hypothetical protein